MTSRRYRLDSPVVGAVARHIRDNGPSAKAAIAQACDIRADAALTALVTLRDAGILRCTQAGGPKALWEACSDAELRTFAAALSRLETARAVAQVQRREPRARRSNALPAEPVRVIRAAAECEPVRAGASSVFSWGGR